MRTVVCILTPRPVERNIQTSPSNVPLMHAVPLSVMSSKTPLFLGVRPKAFFLVTLMLFVSASLLLVSASDETGTVASPLSWAIEDEASGHMNDVVSLSYSPDGKWLAFTMNVKASSEPIVKSRAQPEGASWAKKAITVTNTQEHAT